jgi:thioredoxin reductase (NADPH)
VAWGLVEQVSEVNTYDVTIVGGGRPLARCLCRFGRIKHLAAEAQAPGGQAGLSSRIENYLGFLLGISGQALAAPSKG